MRQIKITTSITSRDSLSLEKYLQDISKVDLLTPEEEVELARRIKLGDEKALEQLTKANLRFVVSVAKQYQNQGISLSDLINEGNLGLIKAARRYDETKGFKFISYAVWWIRQSIMQSLAEQSRMIRLPLNKQEAYQKLHKVLNHFLQENQREPSADELAQLTQMDEKEVSELLKLNSKIKSIDVPLDEDNSDSASYSETLADEGGEPDTQLNTASLHDELLDALSVLSKQEANIIIWFYGLGDKAPMSLDDIATNIKLTRERVRQIKERAIRRLRKTSRSHFLKSYLG
ncbi:RNA polymerase subunit sigma [Sphingobacteriales bacterium UPWRP_1]|nr:RNA polymerase subunit sigma [Sphingobacteriales bacterium TSM_CSS]PSJ77483.1 RNA polymerase subunit sigma [Sphingobacteriales bacterium UPWRP_1]